MLEKLNCYVARVSIFLITVALIAGMAGCGSSGEYNLTMAVAPAGSGTATDLTNASPYAASTVVSIKAVAAAGYRFVNWTATAGTFDNATAAETTFTMPAQNVTVTANFVPFTGGSGTEEDPYQVTDWYQLHNVRNYLDSYFILVNDLDSTTAGYTELASETANQRKGWQPIGTPGDVFTGTFDGQGYEISDLFIDRPDEDYVGLFGYVGIGPIEDVGVVNATVTGDYHVGGLVGYNDGTVSASFWDTETSGQATSAGGTGKTTAEMQDIATFSGAGWNIIAVANPGTRNPSYIWNIVDDETYPFLSWQP